MPGNQQIGWSQWSDANSLELRMQPWLSYSAKLLNKTGLGIIHDLNSRGVNGGNRSSYWKWLRRRKWPASYSFISLGTLRQRHSSNLKISPLCWQQARFQIISHAAHYLCSAASLMITCHQGKVLIEKASLKYEQDDEKSKTNRPISLGKCKGSRDG